VPSFLERVAMLDSFAALKQRLDAAKPGGVVRVTEQEFNQLRSMQVDDDLTPHGKMLRKQGFEEGYAAGMRVNPNESTLTQSHFAMLIELMAAQAKRLQEMEQEVEHAKRPIHVDGKAVQQVFISDYAGMIQGEKAITDYIIKLEHEVNHLCSTRGQQHTQEVMDRLGWDG
jgi:hypothetical protein